MAARVVVAERQADAVVVHGGDAADQCRHEAGCERDGIGRVRRADDVITNLVCHVKRLGKPGLFRYFS
jgi:hypothetical protein